MKHDHEPDSHGIDKGVVRHHLGDTNDTHQGHGGLGVYMMVFVSLCILTLLSFLVGNSAVLRDKAPQVMWAAMMAVSCAKAMLVMLFFMHLKWEANWKWVLTVPASFMSIFLLLMLVPDIGWRQNTGYAGYSLERRFYSAEPQDSADEHHEAEHATTPEKAAH